MIRVAISRLRAHVLRTLLTTGAVALAVAFLAGTLIYRDTARAAFDEDLARPGVGVDVAVLPPYATPLDPGLRLDASVPDRIAALPGIDTVDSRIMTHLPVLGRNGRALTNGGRPGWAVSLPRTPDMSLFRVVDGRQPAARGEALLDRPTAEREGLGVGASITVLDPRGGRHGLGVVGLADYGATQAFAGWSMLALTDADLIALTDVDGPTQVVARGGEDPTVLHDRIAAELGPGYQVLTGAELRERLSVESAKYVAGLRSSLLAAALVALLMSGLVVANTFGILIAQRTRELALVRCVGASRRQVFAAALGEAAVVGTAASVVGAAASVAVAQILLAGRGSVGGYLPEHGLVVHWSTLAVALSAGAGTTVLAGFLPALAASRVSPIAALRSAAAQPAPGRRARSWRLAGAAVLAAGGLAVSASGLPHGFDGTPRVLAGGAVVFGAVVLVLPLVVARLTGLFAWPTRLAFGVTGRLAMANATRNPRRAAAMAIALMIGVAVMSMFSVLVATARIQGERELAENFPADFIVRAADGGGNGPVGDDLLADLRARPEFGAVARTRVSHATVEGLETHAASVEPGSAGVATEVLDGSLDDLGPGRVALRRDLTDTRGIAVGDVVTVAADDHGELSATVVAIYDDTAATGDALLDWNDHAGLLGPTSWDEVIILRSAGASAADARTALDSALAGHPLATVESSAERRDALAEELEGRLVQLGILLGVSTVIALFGIMDTLSLAVLERTRESATLRAIGLGARQLRGMLAVEALLTGLTGGTLGVAFGLGFGWLASYGLIHVYGHGWPTVPAGHLVAYAAAAAAVGVLASVLPARRAARATIAAAIATE